MDFLISDLFSQISHLVLGKKQICENDEDRDN